jgi:hypothetical protein
MKSTGVCKGSLVFAVDVLHSLYLVLVVLPYRRGICQKYHQLPYIPANATALICRTQQSFMEGFWQFLSSHFEIFTSETNPNPKPKLQKSSTLAPSPCFSHADRYNAIVYLVMAYARKQFTRESVSVVLPGLSIALFPEYFGETASMTPERDAGMTPLTS